MELSAHSYVVKGGSESLSVLEKVLEKSGIHTKANSDYFARTYTSFTIDDARSLRDRASLRSMSGEGRVFVVVAPTIPPDAQNALLKTFEEPPAGAKFFLVVPSPETLLPTLRSRMQMFTWDPDSQLGVGIPSVVDAKLFINAQPDKRLEMLKPLLEKGDDDKRDLAGTLAFLGELEILLSHKPRDNEPGLKAIYRARKYMTDRGALAKILLEQTALLIPRL